MQGQFCTLQDLQDALAGDESDSLSLGLTCNISYEGAAPALPAVNRTVMLSSEGRDVSMNLNITNTLFQVRACLRGRADG